MPRRLKKLPEAIRPMSAEPATPVPGYNDPDKKEDVQPMRKFLESTNGERDAEAKYNALEKRHVKAIARITALENNQDLLKKQVDKLTYWAEEVSKPSESKRYTGAKRSIYVDDEVDDDDVDEDDDDDGVEVDVREIDGVDEEEDDEMAEPPPRKKGKQVQFSPEY